VRSAVSAHRSVLLVVLAAALVVGPVGPAWAAPVEPSPMASATTATPTPSSAPALVAPASARLTYGPNCVDGYVRVEVTAGSEAATVELTYDGAPAGDQASLDPGQTVELEGAEVDWGTSVDIAVAVTTAAGPQSPIVIGSRVRPSEADCDAVLTPPPTSPPTTTPTPGTTPPGSSAPTTAPPSTTPVPTTPPSSSGPSSTGPSTTPRPTTPSPSTSAPTTPATPATPGSPSGPLGGSSSNGQVSPGSVVTIRGTGFTPGEQVTVTLAGAVTPLATVTADDQGAVEAVVQIPQDTDLGAAVVQLVGVQSAQTAGVDLEVAAVEVPAATGGTPWPLLAAGLGLLGVAVALASAAARRPRRDDWQAPGGAPS